MHCSINRPSRCCAPCWPASRPRAGYRSRFSRIVVLDPRGLGQRFDPLAGRTSEDECLATAVAMLDASSARGDATDFVLRASAMLAALFRAAALEGIPALLYARQA